MKRVMKEIPHLLLLGLSAAMSALAWSRVPERMPVHWDIHGEVDRFGSRAEGLLVPPALALGIYLLMLLVPLLGFNHALFARAYDRIRLALLGFLVAVHAAMVWRATGHALDVLTVIGALSGLLFIVVGNLMGKLRPNAYAGVRTPWTLTSKLSWTKTHRLAGFLFIGTGALTLLSTLISGQAAMEVMLVASLGTVVVCAAYSWHVWRLDPERGLS